MLGALSFIYTRDEYKIPNVELFLIALRHLRRLLRVVGFHQSKDLGDNRTRG